MGILFRLADGHDIDALLIFMQEYYVLDRLTFDRDQARGALEQIVRDESLGRIWLICDGPCAVGYIVLTLGYSLEYFGRNAFIDEFYIRADHRGRGMGRQALAFVEQVCHELGVKTLHLEVKRANKDAQTLYRRAGFIDHDRYLMTKRLASSPAELGELKARRSTDKNH